jgi:hypothetical protein
MRILRVRHGFQADHSSSSYLFYAADKEVSPAGQRVAHRFSSRADVDEQFARYQKWGDSSLSSEAFPALLGEHYDVMASESYDSWTLMIAVPKTPEMAALLRPFHDIVDEFTRLDVHDYGKRLAVKIHCEFDYEGPLFAHQYEDHLEELVEILVEIRAEILRGNVSFLQAVAEFYGGDADDAEEPETSEAEPPQAVEGRTKAELQAECARRGIVFRKSWTKDELQQALRAASPPARASRDGKPAKLSGAARRIVESLTHV